VKAKELKRRADHLIAIAKNSDAETACKNKKKIKTPVAARRQAIAALRICYNPLTASEAKEVKANDTSSYSTDRLVINKLFGELRTRFKQRDGGYTRIIRTKDRVGDSAPLCLIEYVE
jgi:large subunit ribosomal protein L17